MRIGILSLPLHYNFGGILQTYALQTILERMGHEVVVIQKEYKKQLPVWKMPYCYPKRFFKKYFLKQKVRVFEEQHANRRNRVISTNTKSFCDKYLHTFSCKCLREIMSLDLDAIVVGSDQIWRPKYCEAYYPSIATAFLDFIPNLSITRLAYAVSFGVDNCEYTQEQIDVCKPLAMKFDAISVREKGGVKLCEDLFCIKAVQVLDPTMLLDEKDYLSLINDNSSDNAFDFVLTYLLDCHESSEEVLKYFSHMPIKSVTADTDNDSLPIEQRIQYPVELWLSGFKHAKVIVTDSFHACVFSLIFNKPFIVILNEERGVDRFESLLSLFHQKHRIVKSFKDFEERKEEILKTPDIYTSIAEERQYSEAYLKQYLSDSKITR